MICLVDTDAVIKLTACDLLLPALDIIGAKTQEVFVYREEIRRVCMYDEEILTQYGEPCRTAAMMIALVAQPITTLVEPIEQQYMTAAAIDSGEQVIFSATRMYKDFRVITADRRALRTLAHATGCGAIAKRMTGRVVCVEQVVLMAISSLGFGTCRDQIVPICTCDSGFSEPFANGLDTTPNDATTILTRRIGLLRSEIGAMLVP